MKLFEDHQEGPKSIMGSTKYTQEKIGKIVGQMDSVGWEAFQHFIPFEAYFANRSDSYGYSFFPEVQIIEGLDLVTDEQIEETINAVYECLHECFPKFLENKNVSIRNKEDKIKALYNLPQIPVYLSNLSYLTTDDFCILKYDAESEILQNIYKCIKSLHPSALSYRPYLSIGKIQHIYAEYVIDSLSKVKIDPYRNSKVGLTKLLMYTNRREKIILDYADRA